MRARARAHMCTLSNDNWATFAIAHVRIQSTHSGHRMAMKKFTYVHRQGALFYKDNRIVERLHFEDFDLVVPMCAQFCLGSFKSGRSGRALWQHDGTPKRVHETMYVHVPSCVLSVEHCAPERTPNHCTTSLIK